MSAPAPQGAGGSAGTPPLPPAPSLQIDFEGWYLVRLTTDPDPTDDRRGVSGYTLAVAGEPDFDSWIRLNPPLSQLREPAVSLARLGAMRVGVTVSAVHAHGGELAGAEQLVGGPVELLSDPERGNPQYVGRNSLIGSDETIQFPIDPFIIQVSAPGPTPTVSLRRADVLPEPGAMWQLPSTVWSYRVGVIAPDGDGDAVPSMEVMNAINVYDFYEYYRDRTRYLQSLLAGDGLDDAGREALKTRLYAIEFFGDRIRSRLGLKRIWDFAISRASGSVEGLAGVDLESPWPISFWMGGFDGDLMMGYMRGSLFLPLLA